jgi:hypothetical protein
VRDVFNVITILSVAAWVIGFFVLSMGIFIHMFLLTAILVLIFKAVQDRRNFKKNHLIITNQLK